MIFVTRLDGTELVVNVDLIITIEKTPDTVLTLTTGDRIMVQRVGGGDRAAGHRLPAPDPARTRCPGRAGRPGRGHAADDERPGEPTDPDQASERKED